MLFTQKELNFYRKLLLSAYSKLFMAMLNNSNYFDELFKEALRLRADEESSKRHDGILAEDVKEFFRELEGSSADGYLQMVLFTTNVSMPGFEKGQRHEYGDDYVPILKKSLENDKLKEDVVLAKNLEVFNVLWLLRTGIIDIYALITRNCEKYEEYLRQKIAASDLNDYLLIMNEGVIKETLNDISALELRNRINALKSNEKDPSIEYVHKLMALKKQPTVRRKPSGYYLYRCDDSANIGFASSSDIKKDGEDSEKMYVMVVHNEGRYETLCLSDIVSYVHKLVKQRPDTNGKDRGLYLYRDSQNEILVTVVHNEFDKSLVDDLNLSKLIGKNGQNNLKKILSNLRWPTNSYEKKIVKLDKQLEKFIIANCKHAHFSNAMDQIYNANWPEKVDETIALNDVLVKLIKSRTTTIVKALSELHHDFYSILFVIAHTMSEHSRDAELDGTTLANKKDLYGVKDSSVSFAIDNLCRYGRLNVEQALKLRNEREELYVSSRYLNFMIKKTQYQTEGGYYINIRSGSKHYGIKELKKEKSQLFTVLKDDKKRCAYVYNARMETPKELDYEVFASYDHYLISEQAYATLSKDKRGFYLCCINSAICAVVVHNTSLTETLNLSRLVFEEEKAEAEKIEDLIGKLKWPTKGIHPAKFSEIIVGFIKSKCNRAVPDEATSSQLCIMPKQYGQIYNNIFENCPDEHCVQLKNARPTHAANGYLRRQIQHSDSMANFGQTSFGNVCTDFFRRKDMPSEKGSDKKEPEKMLNGHTINYNRDLWFAWHRMKDSNWADCVNATPPREKPKP